MSAKINCDECSNTACLIKQYCLPIWINKIESNKFQMECKAGDAVFRKGERVNGIYFIKHGKVKIISSGINNDDQIVRVVGNGHIFGHRGAGGIYPFSAIALSDITICFIDNDSFYNVYINNPQFSLEIMKVHSR